MIERYVSPKEFHRLISALLVVIGFISIAALFAFIVVPGLRHAHQPASEAAVPAPQGETGWLDPTDYPAARSMVIPPVDPKTVMSPNPELMARGKVIYEQTCATCHGAEGKGDGPGAGQLNPKPRNFTVKDGWKNGTKMEDIYKTLDEGLKGTSMVSYNYLRKKDRMALVHVVQSMGRFDHGASDAKAHEAFEKSFGSAGETIPNRVPVRVAEALLVKEAAASRALDTSKSPVLRQAIQDPARAARSLDGSAAWKASDEALARFALSGLSYNGFSPAVAAYGPAQWRDLRAALSVPH